MSQPPGLLVFEAPRRGKPPTHLSDMTLAERRDAVAAAGLPRFRADQVSNHWFARLVDDPAQWTDIPAAMREPLASSLCPPLLTNVRDITCDGGLTVKSVWRLHDAAMVESVLMRYPATRTSRERVTVCVIRFLIFPKALAFAEMAARELRYFWWLILLVALARWLIWGFKRRP